LSWVLGAILCHPYPEVVIFPFADGDIVIMDGREVDVAGGRVLEK
jgi:hypothetical protein